MKKILFSICAAAVLCFAALQPTVPAKPPVHTAAAVREHLQKEVQTHIALCLQEVPAEAVKKIYEIPAGALAAPMPDENGYGEAESFVQLESVIAEAEDVLEGQALYLNGETNLLPGTPIRYYLDETIFALTWKQVVNDAVLTCAEVKILHPSQFRRYLSGGEYASGKLSKTTEMAQTVNAVVAGSGDYYSYRLKGQIVWNGTALRNKSGVPDICFVDQNGDMRLEHGLKFENQQALQDYVDENGISFSLAFGPSLVKDGEFVCPKGYYPLGEVQERFTRTAICQMDTLHYLFVAANFESGHYNKMTVYDFARCILDTGCRQAYALDGGQTSSVVMHNKLLNKVNYGSQRNISDIVYFATAKPSEE